MAKLTGPLFSLGAAGKIGNALVYFRIKGRDVVRRWLVPHNPESADQVEQRLYFSQGVDNWQSLDGATQILWDDYADTTGQGWSGFNAMMSRYINYILDEAGDPHDEPADY